MGKPMVLKAPLDVQVKVQWDLMHDPHIHASCHATIALQEI